MKGALLILLLSLTAAAQPDECTRNDDCDDGDACTDDLCRPYGDAGACVPRLSLAGTPCDDLDACTQFEFCDGHGLCLGEVVPCDDGDACTVDACDPSSGCTFAPAEHCGNPQDAGPTQTVLPPAEPTLGDAERSGCTQGLAPPSLLALVFALVRLTGAPRRQRPTVGMAAAG